MRSLLVGVLTGILVSAAACRLVGLNAERHIEEHLRAFEARWYADHERPRCGP